MSYPMLHRVEAELRPADAAALKAAPVDLEHVDATAYQALVGWAHHLGRIFAELGLPDDAPAAWVPDDLVAALIFRDWLELSLAQVDPAVAARVRRIVAQVDEWYGSWTEPDPGIMARVLDDPGHDPPGWWWQRIPPRGPIHAALVAYYGHVHRGTPGPPPEVEVSDG